MTPLVPSPPPAMFPAGAATSVPGSPPWPVWVRGLIMTAAHWGGAEVSCLLTEKPNLEASYWLPSGLILGTLLVTARREWWVMVVALFLGDELFNLCGAQLPFMPWFVATAGNAAAGLMGAWLIQRFIAFRITLASVRELVGLVMLGGGVSLVVTATIGAAMARWLGSPASYREVWASWYGADLLGVILIAPLILVWHPTWARPFHWGWSPGRAEGLAMVAGLCLCVFFAVGQDRVLGVGMRYVVLPFVVWAALRFGPRGVTVVSLAVALLVGWFFLTGQGENVFRQATAHDRNAQLQVALAFIAFFGLIPAIVIAAQARTEAELRQERNFHQAIFDSEPEWVTVISADGGLVQINRAGLVVLEVADIAEARAFGVMNFVLPLDREKFLGLMERVMAGGHGELAYQIRGKQGTVRWLEMNATPLRDGDDRVTALLGVTRDVTARRQAEEALRLARFTVDNATLAMFWVGPDAGIVDANAAASRLLGYELAELRGLRVPDIDVEFSAERWPRHWADLKSAASLEFQSRQRKKDGSLIDVSISTHHLRFGTGELSCAFVQDITEQKRAEDARRKSEEQLKLIFSAVADGIVVHDRDLAIIQCNASAERMLGLSAEEVTGRTSVDGRWRAVREDGRPFPGEAHPAAVALTTGRAVRDTVMGVHKPDGVLTWISVNAEPLRDARGGVTMVVSSFSDITASRALQEQVRQARKMEVVGQLAGGVAHDFNNILTAMMLNIQFMETDGRLPEEFRSPLDDLQGMARRAAKLTEQLLLFARRRVMQVQALEFNASITSVVKLLRRLLGEHIAVEVRLAPETLWINADGGMLDQVVMNLCVNARDAMPEGGTLVIETDLAQLGAPLARAEARPGRFARLRVSDTGSGMTPEVLAHLFEPFFTTKEVGKGTGLGLATVHGIIHQHEGWLEVESAPGRGSTFTVYLPLAPAVEKAPVAEPRAELRGGTETILLVEDEEAVRLVASSLLRRLGYRVLEASHGPEALGIWETRGAEIDLLITDMVMPQGLTGMALAQKLQREKPTLGVILMSGYNEEILRGHGGRTTGLTLVAKPFEFPAFAAVVREKLGPGPAPAGVAKG
ncbi:MAG: PAS domain S-box protein [Undibacterium sp.]|nr:PAS domain S-box protein [Opitutaceae bacterium]